jgi:hypothetical protein
VIGSEGCHLAVAKAQQRQAGQALLLGPELQEMVAMKSAFGTPCSLQAEGPERLGRLRRPAARECKRWTEHTFRARINQSQNRGKIGVAGDLAAQGDFHRRNLRGGDRTEPVTEVGSFPGKQCFDRRRLKEGSRPTLFLLSAGTRVT